MVYAFAVLGALFAAGVAYAARQHFTLVNRTGDEINSVYVSRQPHPLDDGESVDISFEKGERGCTYDLVVMYHAGDKSYWTDLDLCSISKIRCFWDRKAGNTRAVTE